MKNCRLRFALAVLVALAVPCVSFLPKSYAQTEEKELFLVAQRAFEDGFYDVAIRYINDFLQKYPQSERLAQVKLLLGQCYFFKEQYVKAYEIFQSLLNRTEFKDATLFWLGETYLKGADYAQAEKNYRQLIELYPDSIYTPQAYYSLGWSYFDQKKYDQAQDFFKTMLDKFPSNQLKEDATLKLAECAYNSGRYKDAIDGFQKYLSLYPNGQRLDEVYFNIGEAHYYLENYDDALKNYRKAGELSHDAKLTVMAKVSEGWSLLKLKNFKDSQASFEQAEALAKDKGVLNDEIYLGKASLFNEQAIYDQALAAYDTLIQQFPQSRRVPEAQLGRANIYYVQKRYEDAIREYQGVIRTFAASPDDQETVEKSYFGLAWTYLKMGDIDRSINSFRDVLAKTENKSVKVSALTQIGDAYQDSGQLEKAVDIYDQILKEFPDSIYSDYVQYREGIALLKSGKMEAASLAFQSLETNFPQSKYLNDVDYYLGVAYFKKGDWDLAIKKIESFLKKIGGPTHELAAEANYVLALSYLNSQKLEDALKGFQKILRLYPNDSPIVKNSEIGIAKCYYQLGQMKEALKRFKIIIYKYPNTEAESESLLWLARFYVKSSEYTQAAEYFEQYVAHFPGSEDIDQVRYELGQLYEAQGTFDKALNQYKLISTRNREIYSKAELAIAEIFTKELDPDQAVATYEAIIKSSSEFQRDAYLKIAQVYRKSQNYEKELDIYQKALKSDQGLSKVTNAELEFDMADTLELMNKLDAAVDEYLKIPYLYRRESDWVIKAYLRVARIFENREDWSNAVITYQKISGFNTEEAKYAQERLDWIKKNHPKQIH